MSEPAGERFSLARPFHFLTRLIFITGTRADPSTHLRTKEPKAMIHQAIASPAKLAAIAALADARPQKSFDITPVIHPQHGLHPENSRTFWSATANAHYITRSNGEDLFGPMPDFASKLVDCPDLVAHGRRGPIGCDGEGLAGDALWRAADQAALTDRPSAPVAYHAIGWLPVDRSPEDWKELILQFLDEQIVCNGMVADWALHALDDGAGGWIKKPHLHAVITARFWKGPRRGQPQAAWLATAKQRTAAEDYWDKSIYGAVK